MPVHRVSPDELEAPFGPEVEAPSTAASIGAPVVLNSLFTVGETEDAQSLDDISEEGEEHFEPFDLKKKNGDRIRVYIKRVDFMSALDIEAGRILVRNAQVQRAPAREAKVGVALEVMGTLYRKTSNGEYRPFFKDNREAQSWMARSQNKDLNAQVLMAVYLVNPELDPEKKMHALMKAQK